MRAKAIMLLGTSSHVGKSLLTAALCRIFADLGYSVAPFKSQNMSLNSAATIEGLEIGRAQALQAEAAGIAASVDMNPILLKPCGDMTSQIVVRGKIWGKLTAYDYHQRRVEELMPIIRESYDSLASRHEVIIIEGAGSPAEINLKQHDIVNMRIAEMTNAHCILVGDIDRGGVFASLLGTVDLLEPAEQARIQGFLINKFRGDLSLLTPGIRMMEDRLQKPCLGVIPFIRNLVLEEEDSLGLPVFDTASISAWVDDMDPHRRLRIAIITLPSFSNFTDFDALRVEPSVDLRFCRTPEQLSKADIILIPGSKQTVDDLLWMRTVGLDEALKRHAQDGLTVGICGGMQMLGQEIDDPHGIESAGSVTGLGLLPIRTTMQTAKVTALTQGRLTESMLFGHTVASDLIAGYEIHVGQTTYLQAAKPFASIGRHAASAPSIDAQHKDGCISEDSRTFGTYLHGIFDEDDFRHAFLSSARSFHRLAPASRLEDWKRKRKESFDLLARTVQENVDLHTIFSWVGRQYVASLHSSSGDRS